MQPAFGLGAVGPPAGALVVTVDDGLRARPAADRRVAAVGEWMVGDAVGSDVGDHVGVRPPGERVDLHHTAQEVVVDERCRPSCGGVAAPEAAHPGGPSGQRTGEGLDLAGRAAGIGVGLPHVHGQPGFGADDAQIEVETRSEVVGEPFGLGEEVAGVEQRDLDAGDRLARHVGEHGVAETGGHTQPATELAVGPAKHAMGVDDGVVGLLWTVDQAGERWGHDAIQSKADQIDQLCRELIS